MIKNNSLATHTWFNSNVLIPAVFLLAAFIAYFPSLQGPFFFDDEHFILKNNFVKEFDLFKIFTSSVTQGAALEGNFYRPLQQVVFACLYRLFGMSPFPFHLLSLLLHFANACLLYSLLRRICLKGNAPLIASLLFLLHPVQTEAVSYISGLSDPLSLFFILLGLHLFLKSENQTAWNFKKFQFLLISCLLFVLALSSKESAVIALPLSAGLIVFREAVNQKSIRSSAFYSLMPMVFITAGYILLRFTVLRFSDSGSLTEEKNIYTEHLHIRLITFLSILPQYFKMLFSPIHLFYEKPYTAYTQIMSAPFFGGLVAVMISVYCFIRRSRYPVLYLGSAWFIAAMIPFMGIVPLNAMYLEHWLYVPGIGFFIVAAFLADQIPSVIFKRALWIIPLLFALRTFSRNYEWGDVERFYLNELKYNGQTTRIYNNLGMYYADQKKFDRAIPYYMKAIASDNSFAQPHHNLANIYIDLLKYPEALEELHKALLIDPSFTYSLSRVMDICKAENNHSGYEQARALLENAMQGGRNNKEKIELLFGTINRENLPEVR